MEDYTDFEDKIDEYFATVSDEQLERDLEKSGYDFYKHVNENIFGVHADERINSI